MLVLAFSVAVDYAREGLPVVDSIIAYADDVRRAHVMEPPYVVKPVAEGSSFGVLIVHEDHPHPPQSIVSDEWPYGDRIMIERFVHGRELTCAVMGDQALGVTEIFPIGHSFYDYESKYAEGGSKHEFPA